MPAAELLVEFERTRSRWEALGEALVPLVERLAVETVADALPGAAVLEVQGEVNEDWLRVLRIQRVRSATGEVLFDASEGHDDPRVEAVLDEVNAEYLDLLVDLTGDQYLGDHTLESLPTTTPSVAAVAAELRRSVREREAGLLYRQLIQVNDNLVSEPPASRLALCLTPPPLTGDPGVDAFLAAVVEYRLGEHRLSIPEWTSRPERYCDPPWDVAGIPSLAEEVRRCTPAPFERHGVLIVEEDLSSA